MVDITSSDVALLFDAPDTVFDDARIINEFGSAGAPKPVRGDRIAGTTEMEVGKSMSGGAGKSRRAQILSKTKVILRENVI